MDILIIDVHIKKIIWTDLCQKKGNFNRIIPPKCNSPKGTHVEKKNKTKQDSPF